MASHGGGLLSRPAGVEYGAVATDEALQASARGEVCLCGPCGLGYGARWADHSPSGKALRVMVWVISAVAVLFGVPALMLEFSNRSSHDIEWHAVAVSGIFTLLALPVSVLG